MAAYTSTPVTDPDQLGYEIAATDLATDYAGAIEEIVISPSEKRIALKVTGNLTDDGATIKAVYSKLKDAWRVDSELIKYPFPMGPITDEQFELLNGWNWDKVQTTGAAVTTTPFLLRTGGWQVLDTDVGANPLEQWAGIISLGTLVDTTDQVYLQQVNEDEASVNIVLTNAVNQAVQILDDPNGDGSYVDGYDKRNYFKLFVREWQKLYAQSEIGDIGVSSMTFQAYRFPLTNSADLKVTNTEGDVNTLIPYTNIDITYLRHTDDTRYNVLGTYSSAGVSYVEADVVESANGRWYKNILGYTSDATQPEANSTNWAAYEGERLIGTTYYPYTVIIDGDTTVGPTISGAATTAEIYEKIQYQLRQDADIDEDATAAINGKTADALLRFVGDTLVTSTGVYIDSFNSSDTNSITFTDATGSANTFPFVASLRVNFGTNLQDDQFAKYWVFFTSANGNAYGTTSAIVVNDNDSVPMTADVNPAWPSKRAFVDHTFNYDNNTQGGRTPATNAAITVVGLGLSTGQYVSAESTIGRSTANSVSLVSALERNYEVGSV